MIDKILDIVSNHTTSIKKAKTLIELAELETQTVKDLYNLFNYDKRSFLKNYEKFIDSKGNIKDVEQSIEWFLSYEK